jgi:uncharacterized membrane protein
MGNNTVMQWVIPFHAVGATIALVLGGYNLRHRPKGDRTHRLVGRIWVVAMYWTVLSSFLIKDLRPGHFSWIHGLSVFTFGTLSLGLWAALTHRVQLHRRFMTGSYLGLLGAFVGAVAVPVRHIPQWAVHQPLGLGLAATGCVLASVALIALSRRLQSGLDPRRPKVQAPEEYQPAKLAPNTPTKVPAKANP